MFGIRTGRVKRELELKYGKSFGELMAEEDEAFMKEWEKEQNKIRASILKKMNIITVNEECAYYLDDLDKGCTYTKKYDLG